MSRPLSAYERSVLQEIHNWKNPRSSAIKQGLELLNWPLDKTGELINKIPKAEWVIEKAIGGITELLSNLAHRTVRPAAICKSYRSAGYAQIQTPADIFELDLEDVDRLVGSLATKYKSLAGVEGATVGLVGLPGIPSDIVALITINQRAIGEYATYFGFDISTQAERLFAYNILELVSSPTEKAKRIAMEQLLRIGQDVAKKKVWKDLERQTLLRIVQIIAHSLGVRLTKAKLSQALPLLGSIAGGGFNAYYTGKICEAAYYLYRERFLAEKYGADIIDAIVKPADQLEPELTD